jgi:hypothetical protein
LSLLVGNRVIPLDSLRSSGLCPADIRTNIQEGIIGKLQTERCTAGASPVLSVTSGVRVGLDIFHYKPSPRNRSCAIRTNIHLRMCGSSCFSLDRCKAFARNFQSLAPVCVGRRPKDTRLAACCSTTCHWLIPTNPARFS